MQLRSLNVYHSAPNSMKRRSSVSVSTGSKIKPQIFRTNSNEGTIYYADQSVASNL